MLGPLMSSPATVGKSSLSRYFTISLHCNTTALVFIPHFPQDRLSCTLNLNLSSLHLLGPPSNMLSPTYFISRVCTRVLSPPISKSPCLSGPQTKLELTNILLRNKRAAEYTARFWYKIIQGYVVQDRSYQRRKIVQIFICLKICKKRQDPNYARKKLKIGRHFLGFEV